jgi:hypothetical protein
VAAVVGGAIYILADALRTIVLFSTGVVVSLSDNPPPYPSGLTDDLGVDILALAILSLFALLLGLIGGAIVNADGPSATPPPATSS